MQRARSVTLAALAAVAILSLSAEAAAQCETDDDCRYGRVCRDGRCAYPESSCETDVDCPRGQICETGRCVTAAPVAEPAREAEGELLPPPRPSTLSTLRPRQTDGGEAFVDPIEWGSRGAISPRPHGTSVFDFQYGSGEIPCPNEPDEGCDANSFVLTLGGDSIVANIISIGFSMALFRWASVESVASDDFSLGDIQMRLAILAYRHRGRDHWFGLSPFLRILLSSSFDPSRYIALLEPGLALGYAYRIFSVSLHLAGMVGVGGEETFGGFLSHLSVGVRPIDLLAVIVDLEVGYGAYNDYEAVPVALLAGLRFFLGSSVVLDISSRFALNQAARISDPNAAIGLWSLGLRLTIAWRGLGRP